VVFQQIGYGYQFCRSVNDCHTSPLVFIAFSQILADAASFVKFKWTRGTDIFYPTIRIYMITYHWVQF